MAVNGWLERQTEKVQLCELRLLGTAMARPDLADIIVSSVDSGQFRTEALKPVAAAIWSLRRDGRPCGMEDVTDRLVGQNLMDQVGNAGSLYDILLHAEDDTSAVEEFAELSRRRRVYTACHEGMALAMNPDMQPDDAAAEVLARLHDPLEVSVADPIWTDELLAMQPPTWLVEGIVPEGLTVLFGSPKTGKSYVGLTLAWNLAVGRTWFGHPTAGKRKVLYLAGEGVGDLMLRSEALLEHTNVNPGGDLQFWPHLLRLSRDSDAARLRLMVEKSEADLIVVDTWARYAGVRDENDAAQVQSAVNALESLTRAGRSVLLIHHSGKDGTLRGSTALAGAVEAAIKLEINDDTQQVKMSSVLSRRGSGFPDMTLQFRKSGRDSVMELCR